MSTPGRRWDGSILVRTTITCSFFHIHYIFFFTFLYICVHLTISKHKKHIVEGKYWLHICVFVQFIPFPWLFSSECEPAKHRWNTRSHVHIHPLNPFPSEASYVELLLPPCNIFWHLTEAKRLLPWCAVTPAPWHKQPWTEQSCAILRVMPSARSSFNCQDQRPAMPLWQPVQRQH